MRIFKRDKPEYFVIIARYEWWDENRYRVTMYRLNWRGAKKAVPLRDQHGKKVKGYHGVEYDTTIYGKPSQEQIEKWLEDRYIEKDNGYRTVKYSQG